MPLYQLQFSTLSIVWFESGYQAQAMKEQALLKEEMAYQYKLGNFEVNLHFFQSVIGYISA